MPFRKVIAGDRYLYFIHGPPQTDLDPPNGRLPEPPYAKAPRELSSVYYYWWAFLRLNAEYREYCERFERLSFEERHAVIVNGGSTPLEKIYSDFGDVRGEDFIPWWKDHGAHCFAEPEPDMHVGVLDALPYSHDFERRVLLSVPLETDIEATMKMLRAQLRPLMDKFRARHGGASKAKYPVTGVPQLPSLDMMLRLKTVKLVHPVSSLDEIADLAGIKVSSKDRADGHEPYEARRKNVSRQLLRADRLIANVVKGRFLDFS